MTKTEKNIEKIRKACIAANHEIMELKLGCRLRDKGDGEKYIFIDWHFNSCPTVMPIEAYGKHWQDDGCAWQDSIFSMGSVGGGPIEGTPETYEIQGREIRLSDVLMILPKKYMIDSSGNFAEEICCQEYDFCGIQWNLEKDNLEEQSEETLSFIANLLPE